MRYLKYCALKNLTLMKKPSLKTLSVKAMDSQEMIEKQGGEIFFLCVATVFTIAACASTASGLIGVVRSVMKSGKQDTSVI